MSTPHIHGLDFMMPEPVVHRATEFIHHQRPEFEEGTEFKQEGTEETEVGQLRNPPLPPLPPVQDLSVDVPHGTSDTL